MSVLTRVFRYISIVTLPSKPTMRLAKSPIKAMGILITLFWLLGLIHPAFAEQAVASDQITQSARPTLEARIKTLESDADLNPLIDRIAQANLVLLGEASHGTEEYYSWRRLISKRLIEEHNFDFIAVEGDFDSFTKVDSWIKGSSADGQSAEEVLQKSFNRWPEWMWANTEVEKLITELRAHNSGRIPAEQVAIYGFDLYGALNSKSAAKSYLESRTDETAQNHIENYRCLAPFRDDLRRYAQHVARGGNTCHSAVTSAYQYLDKLAEGAEPDRKLFQAQQHGLVVKNAEAFYRGLAEPGTNTWNIRARHFFATVQQLLKHYERQKGRPARGILWAHNTHVGDARATGMRARGEVNIGQLAREVYGSEQVAIVGFGTYHGSVVAGRSWGAKAEILRVPDAIPGSIEAYFQTLRAMPWMLIIDSYLASDPQVAQSRPHRAIGVVYHPEQEAHGNYVPTILAQRYDVFIFLPKTKALVPL